MSTWVRPATWNPGWPSTGEGNAGGFLVRVYLGNVFPIKQVIAQLVSTMTIAVDETSLTMGPGGFEQLTEVIAVLPRCTEPLIPVQSLVLIAPPWLTVGTQRPPAGAHALGM